MRVKVLRWYAGWRLEIAPASGEQQSRPSSAGFARLAELRQREAGYVARYGLDYITFAQRTATDENYVHQIETQVSKVWEADLANWEFCHKGIQDWTRHMQTLLAMETAYTGAWSAPC